MSDDRFYCRGWYFGRYCTDEREYEYAKILERDNKETLKAFERWEKRADEVLEDNRRFLDDCNRIIEYFEKLGQTPNLKSEDEIEKKEEK